MTNDTDMSPLENQAELDTEAADTGTAGTPFTQTENHLEHLRIVEAVLFAASEPLDDASIKARLPEGADLEALLEDLTSHYATRGINLVKVAGKWAFRTADDLAFLMQREAVEQKRLSRAALETLAIIAYHQPVTRAEIEEVRGVAVNKGTIDVLLETSWIRLRGRRRTPGRPVTYGTSDGFLDHFGLEGLDGLPGLEELKAAGLLSGAIPAGFEMPGVAGGGEEDEEDIEPEDEIEEDDQASFENADQEPASPPNWLSESQDGNQPLDDPAEFAKALGDDKMGGNDLGDAALDAEKSHDKYSNHENSDESSPHR